MPRRVRLPRELRRRSFTTAEAVAAGLTRGRLRGRDLSSPFYGVRDVAADAPPSVESLALAYSRRMTPSQAFSHLTAARLLGLRIPEGTALSARLHVGAIAPARPPRLAGVRGHRLLTTTETVRTTGGLCVCAPVETWIQLASILSVDGLVVMGDGLVSRQHPLATMEQIDAAVARCSGRPGAAKLRAALPQVRPNTDSARETMVRLAIVRAGLPEPTVNTPIRNEFGIVVAIGDMVYEEYRVLVEYDGWQHGYDPVQFHRDISRLDAVMELRWRVIRVDKALYAARATMLSKIRTALIAGGWRG